MKAVVVSKAGGPEVLEVKEIAKPQVKTGWSLVKIKGFGINHSEIFTRQGLSPSVVFPRILGIELVGVIEETTEPDRLPVGQKVVSIMGELGEPLTVAMQSTPWCLIKSSTLFRLIWAGRS